MHVTAVLLTTVMILCPPSAAGVIGYQSVGPVEQVGNINMYTPQRVKCPYLSRILKWCK